MTGLEIGFTLKDIDPAQAADLESLGADSLWVGGHIMWPIPTNEPLAQLALLAASTSRCRIGTAVLQLPLYQPAIVAKQVATIDRFSRGRVSVGVGVAGEHPIEFEACQVPIKERGARTDEAIHVLRELWSRPSIDHAGPFYPMRGASIDPPPHQTGGPPMIVAGRKTKAMERAALHGDGWIPYLYSAERYATSREKILKLVEAHDRDITDFIWSVYVFVEIDEDPDVARGRLAARLGRSYGQNFDEFVDRVAACGTVRDVTARMQEFADAGARHFVFAGPADGRVETARLLIEDVVPFVRVPGVEA